MNDKGVITTVRNGISFADADTPVLRLLMLPLRILFKHLGSPKQRKMLGFEGGKVMAKIVFKFFEVNVEDGDVGPFLEKIKEVLSKFAGDAYHFRYYLEEPSNATRPKTQKNGPKSRYTAYK